MKHNPVTTLVLAVFIISLGAIRQHASAAVDVGLTAPDPPVLVSPADAAEGRTLTPTLTIKASDPAAERLTVTFYGRPAPIFNAAADFTLVVLPDTQKYTVGQNDAREEMFYAQTQWAADNQAGMNIAFVSQVGDLTESGDNASQTEWQIADKAMRILEQPRPGLPDGIPYGISIGNHDQISGTRNYNRYFGAARFADRSYYGGHFSNENKNYYEFFSAGGLDFIVINLEYSPSPEILAWANDLLKTHPMQRAIVVSHEILPDHTSKFSNIGRAIYGALKGNPNLFLMLCGHYSGTERRQDTDPGTGKTIYTLLADYQKLEGGGNGWLRLLKFSPTRNLITVNTYSPYLDQWDPSGINQFTIKYNMTDSAYQEIGSAAGVVSGSNVSISWPNLAENRVYEWYATVGNEKSTTIGPTWKFTTGSKPVARGETYNLQQDTSLNIKTPGLLANDFYRGRGSLRVVLAKTAAHGILDLHPDGSFLYTPDKDYIGSDRFVYWVSDGVLYSSNVVVDLTILPEPDISPP